MTLTFLYDINLIDEKLSNHSVVLNMSSAYENAPRLKKILPPRYRSPSDSEMIDYGDEKIFDIFYAEYLLNDNEGFLALFTIVYAVYSDYDVYVLVGHDDYNYRESITSSLIKFIQQRYGLNARIMESLDDIAEQNEQCTFSTEGLFVFDQDREKFINLFSDKSFFPDTIKEILS